MKISCVFFNGHVNLGGSFREESIDLRGPSRIKPLIESMDYDPSTGEVVVHTTIRCGLTGGKAPGRIRFPSAKVSHVVEDMTPVAKAKPAQAAKVEA